jgi:hypothetical protein
VADIPWAMQDVRDYRRRLLDRAEGAVAAYQAGRATEAQMREAVRDFGYADMSITLDVIGTAAGIALNLRSRRGVGLDLTDREALERFWRDESGAVGPQAIGSDWAVRPNEGIQWGGPLRLQGLSWEDMLERRGGLGDRLPGNFEGVDFFDFEARLATSAKTLDTQGRSYLGRPSSIYNRLRGRINDLRMFSGSSLEGVDVTSEMIERRRLELAIPLSTNADQMFHVQRAIDYARSVSVEVVVTRIR